MNVSKEILELGNMVTEVNRKCQKLEEEGFVVSGGFNRPWKAQIGESLHPRLNITVDKRMATFGENVNGT